MKKYYVNYYRDFSNTYNLYYTDETMDIEIPKSWKQITRSRAIMLAIRERKARKYDETFAYFADAEIYPVDFDRNEEDIRNNYNYYLDGYIWKKKN